MDNIVNRLPIAEDPLIIEDMLERYEDHLAKIDMLSESIDGSNYSARQLAEVKNELHEMYMLAISTNIPPIVEPMEVMYNIFGKIISCDPELPWLFQATVAILDRLHDMIRSAHRQGSVEFDVIQIVQDAILPLARSQQTAEIYEASRKVVNILIGDFKKQQDEPGVELFEADPYIDNKVEIPRSDVDRTTVSFLQILAETVDSRHEFWKGRTEKLLSMAVGMNALADNTVDLFQLEAAIYLHDFPMVRLCDDLLVKTKLNRQEFEIIRAHPVQAYEMTLALPNLAECSKIVYQHHERVDGSGYPEKITGPYITDGAKILAICDAFYSMTHSTPNKPLRKSILRAVVEINACRGKQFDSFWVDKFNTIVRTQRLGGFL